MYNKVINSKPMFYLLLLEFIPPLIASIFVKSKELHCNLIVVSSSLPLL